MDRRIKYKLQDDFVKIIQPLIFYFKTKTKLIGNLFKNSNDKAVNLLLQNQDKIDWENFRIIVINTLLFFLKNPDKINCYFRVFLILSL
jgi:hypothetical protein